MSCIFENSPRISLNCKLVLIRNALQVLFLQRLLSSVVMFVKFEFVSH